MILYRLRQILPRLWGRAANDAQYGASCIVAGADWVGLLHLRPLWTLWSLNR